MLHLKYEIIFLQIKFEQVFRGIFYVFNNQICVCVHAHFFIYYYFFIERVFDYSNIFRLSQAL